jgi:hypothetical protein
MFYRPPVASGEEQPGWGDFALSQVGKGDYAFVILAFVFCGQK